MNNSVPQRIPLDNAAQIFPTVFSVRETTLSRIGIVLDAPVEPLRMEDSIAAVMKRFPYFQVYLRKGFRDYFFERTDDLPRLEKDGYWTNGYVDFHHDNFLFRLKYRDNQITIESSHILTDGFGTLAFLYSLLAEYYRSEGIDAGESPFVLRPGEEVPTEEWECAYKRIFSSRGPGQKVPPAAFVPRGELIPEGEYHSTRFRMDRNIVKAMANEEKATVYIFMTALYASCLEEIYLEDIASGTAGEGLPLRIQVPVNLRADYPLRAMRNFSYVYSPSIEVSAARGAHSHIEIVKLLSEQIRHERHSGSLEKQIARNLRAERLMQNLRLPRFFKDLIFKTAYTLMARKMYSGVLTNLGEMAPPPGIASRVRDFEIIPCNSPVPGRNSALYSYRGRLDMNIGSSTRDQRLEDKMGQKLEALGIPYELTRRRAPGE